MRVSLCHPVAGRELWKFCVLVLAATLALASYVLPVRAAESATAGVIIVDSSGSMAAQEADGRVRLDAAREAIVEAVSTWPARSELAVVAYGHRRTGDCNDIETIVPMGPVSADTVAGKLAGLRARGKTPLSESLRAAARLLPAEGGDIVLVSDGLETCEADPCAVARDLKAANASVAIHVISFGVTVDEREQLQCIAEGGGGRYFAAEDSVELGTALGEVAAMVAEPEPVPVEPEHVTAIEPAPSPKPVTLTANAGALGEIVDAPVSWVVTGPAGETQYEGTSRTLELSLLPGTYNVSAAAANATGETEIVVADGDAAQDFRVEVMAGRLDLALAANAKSEPFDDLAAKGIAWSLEPLDGQPPAAIPAVARPSLLLAPGRYKINATLQGMVADGTVEVAPGEPATLTLDFQLGTLVLEAALAEDGPALDDVRGFDWLVGSGEAATAVQGQSRPRLTLRAGTYPVMLDIAGSRVTAQAEVSAGEERVARVMVEGGELNLSARLGPDSSVIDDWRDASWSVTAVAAVGVAPGAPATEEPLAEAMPRLTLTPGVWRVGLVSGMAQAAKDVTIAPGDVTDIVFDLGAGRLNMLATPEAGEPPLNIVYAVHALGADGLVAAEPTFSTGSSGDASVILPAGRWRVTAVDDTDRRAEADIELRAGEVTGLQMSLR